ARAGRCTRTLPARADPETTAAAVRTTAGTGTPPLKAPVPFDRRPMSWASRRGVGSGGRGLVEVDEPTRAVAAAERRADTVAAVGASCADRPGEGGHGGRLEDRADRQVDTERV